MAWTNLFTIGTTDLSAFEDKEAHKVNKTDVYETWTDGNWTDHRVIARTRVSGTVGLKFPKESDFTNFLSLMASARNADGYYSVSVWCSNTGTTETITAYLDIIGQTAWDVTSPRKWQGVTVQITGR